MNYNMQQDVLNIVRIDVSARFVFCPHWQVASYITLQDSLSAESVTVVEMPSSVLKPLSYSGNKPLEITMDACNEKSMKSIQSDVSAIQFCLLDLSMSFMTFLHTSLHIP